MGIISVGDQVPDLELARPDGSMTTIGADVDQYLIIQILRYYG